MLANQDSTADDPPSQNHEMKKRQSTSFGGRLQIDTHEKRGGKKNADTQY
jgi:hypothetical protein